MTCKNCKDELCNHCFITYIEKKVRKNIRINKLINKEDKILVIGDIAEFFITRIIKDPKIQLFFRKKINVDFIKRNEITKIITNYCLDDKNHDELNSFLNDTKKEIPLKYINIFNVILKQELERFAKIQKFDFKIEKDDIDEFIDKLDKKHRGTKYSFAKW